MLTILVATMTGTAKMVAEAVRDWLVEQGGVAEIRMMDTVDPGDLVAGGIYLVCSSTCGQGDVPDNARALFDRLNAERPDLGKLAFGLIALGDMTYPQTFCFGGKRIGRLLTELGATMLGEPLHHDASTGTLPEDVAVEWFATWAATHHVVTADAA